MRAWHVTDDRQVRAGRALWGAGRPGTTIAPRASAPEYTRAKSGTFGTIMATRSPEPIPRDRRAPA